MGKGEIGELTFKLQSSIINREMNTMKRYTYINFLIDLFVLIFVLLSYYIKKQTGLIFYNVITISFFICFIVYSLFILGFAKKRYLIIIFQIAAVILFYFILKLDLADSFALLIEVPRIERRIENIKQTHESDSDVEISDEYMLFAWEPGFLDYQQVLVYDEKDDLKNAENGRKIISIGKLYVLERARDCFYLCLLYR